ncbi:sensor histidine kinase [Pseudonocardia humida]|uniref:Histidine kinase/HSP90-like ATPase domain-containing protein n=1 Tax=Pseudonocardia humida TaxID=2800819 RepID=A0ABT1A0B3_9PSEU|nr:histidine kinase [Pseudonocardia humida]MCO1656423.1 hypothetical protein [Pseudonocardia humida]
MQTDERPGTAESRHVWVFAVVFLGTALPAVVGIAAYWAGPAAGVLAAATFVLPMLYAVPRGRPSWARHRNPLLAVQGLLTYLPFAFFGADWVAGPPGFLGGLLLLTVSAPTSWLLFGAALATEGVLRFAVVGLPRIEGLPEAVLIFVVPLYAAAALFGLIRLSGLVDELRAARTELATLTVAGERLRAADRLRAAVGDRLDAAVACARAASALLTSAPEEARARLAEAAGCARQALDQVRAVVADDRRAPWPAVTAAQEGAAAPTVAPRLARLVLTLALVALSAQLLATALADHHMDALVAVASVVGVVALVALQLYHSTAWREHARPRGWPWTLAAQVLLLVLGYFPVLHATIHGLGGFVAGSALLLLPAGWGWAAFAGIQLAIAVHTLVLPGLDTADIVYSLVVTVTTGLVVYGLSRLAGLAVELDDTRRELARMAVVRERLRVARDTHDLLGMGLSAVALKSDLAGRLIDRADDRARAEIDALVRLGEQAGADVLAVTDDVHRLSLRTELDAAAEVLASAGVAADVRADRADEPLPEEVDSVLATVLRESVTNVLRHARARRCGIELTVDATVAHLRVTNDGRGEPRDQPQRPGGHGLANLSARAAALGGSLSTRAEAGGFELTVRLPLAGSAGQAGEQPLAAGGAADGVDEVVGGPGLDQEPGRADG